METTCAKTKGMEGRIMHKSFEQIVAGFYRYVHIFISKKIFFSDIVTINYLKM